MSHMMFFLPSTFRFCPLLKNDGRGELHLRKAVSDFSPNKRKNTNCKPSPLVGKQANHFSRSGATLQKCVRRFALAKVSTDRLTKGASVSRHERTKISISRNENGFYRTVLNTCLSFLNKVKNLAKGAGGKCILR